MCVLVGNGTNDNSVRASDIDGFNNSDSFDKDRENALGISILSYQGTQGSL